MPLLSIDTWKTLQRFKRQNPVRVENSGERNLDFSQWLREHGRPSKAGCFVGGIDVGCFVVNDLDFILWDYQRRVLQLLEVKTHGARLTYSQSQLFPVIDRMIRAGASAANVRYLGFHVLHLDGTTPTNSTKITWDDQNISKEVCWRRINMLDDIADWDMAA